MTKCGVLGVERFAVLAAAAEPLNSDGAVDVGADITSRASVATHSTVKICAETHCMIILQKFRALEPSTPAASSENQTTLNNEMTNEGSLTRT